MAEKKRTSPSKAAWYGLLGILILGGLAATVIAGSRGLVVFGMTDVVVWTLPIAAYVFFALTSTGLALVASLPLVVNSGRFGLVAKRAVYLALGSLAAAFISLAVDLGSLGNLINFVTSPNLSSPIWWMGALYAIEGVLLLVKFWRMHVGDWHSRTSKVISVFALLSAIAASSTLGMVFGTLEARPSYLGAFAPGYFLLTALLSGLAAILLFSIATRNLNGDEMTDQVKKSFDSLAEALVLVAGITLIFFIWRTLFGVSSGSQGLAALRASAGSLSFQFVLWLGLVAPFLMLLNAKVRASASLMIAASALILVGQFADRVGSVFSAQAIPLGPHAVGLPALVSHGSTVWEWLVVGLSLGVLLLVYSLGEQHLKLDTAG